MNAIGQKITGVFFLAVLFSAGTATVWASVPKVGAILKRGTYAKASATLRELDRLVHLNVPRQTDWIDLYGLAQRILRKNTMENATIVRDRAGFLHRGDAPAKNMEALADNLAELCRQARERGIAFLFLQGPSDVLEGVTELPPGVIDRSNERLDAFQALLDQRAVPYVDARRLVGRLRVEPAFFRADHHWTTEMAFVAVAEVVDRLNAEYGLNLDPEKRFMDLANYRTETHPSTFLGSLGIRTGRYYVGRDDLLIFLPTFPAAFHLRALNPAGRQVAEGRGSFRDAFIEDQRLAPDYNNKLSCFLKTSMVETRIVNEMAPNGLKCLIIGDSFNRCSAPYLSLCFAQTAVIDPQPGRYYKSVPAYMDEFKPDVVVSLSGGRWLFVPVNVSGGTPTASASRSTGS